MIVYPWKDLKQYAPLLPGIDEGICCAAFPKDTHMSGRHPDVSKDFVKVVVALRVK